LAKTLSAKQTAWQRTLQHAGHAQRATRNEATVQLCQPPMPESRVRGVVGVRVFGDVQISNVSFHFKNIAGV